MSRKSVTGLSVMVGTLTAALLSFTPQVLATGQSDAPVGSPSSLQVIPKAAASATWGVRNGKPFYHASKGALVGRYVPDIPKVGSATPAVRQCTEYISDVSFSGGKFKWTTRNTCYQGAVGMDIHSQMLRSSYRGDLGYSAWAIYPAEGLYHGTQLVVNWTIGCSSGKGFYNYHPIMYAYSEGFGTGPTIRSNNQLNHVDCGPSF